MPEIPGKISTFPTLSFNLVNHVGCTQMNTTQRVVDLALGAEVLFGITAGIAGICMM